MLLDASSRTLQLVIYSLIAVNVWCWVVAEHWTCPQRILVLQHIGSLILKLGCLVYVAMGRYVVPDPNSPCIVVFDMPMHCLSSLHVWVVAVLKLDVSCNWISPQLLCLNLEFVSSNSRLEVAKLWCRYQVHQTVQIIKAGVSTSGIALPHLLLLQPSNHLSPKRWRQLCLPYSLCTLWMQQHVQCHAW